MLIFAAACVVFFRLGVSYASLIQSKWSKPVQVLAPTEANARSNALSVMAVLVISVNLLSLWTIVRQNFDIVVGTLFGGQETGARFKSEFVSAEGMLAANPLLILIAWMLYAERQAGNRSRRLLYLLLAATVLSATLSVVKLARYELIPLLIGLALIKLRTSYNSRSETGARPIKTILVYSGFGVAIFVFFASLRGQLSGPNGVTANVTGYFLASFNRLAAIFDGSLIMSHEGTGIYVLNFLSNLPIIGPAIGTFLPNNSEVFVAEFADVEGAGLVRSYNWLTMYGYYYIDLGIWVLPFCLIFGIMTQVAWKSFTEFRMLGTLLYPYLAAALILSFSFYWITRPLIASIVIFFVLYSAVNFLARSVPGSNSHRRGTPKLLPDDR